MKRGLISIGTCVIVLASIMMAWPIQADAKHKTKLINYTHIPPFIPNTVPPNVMFIVDNSETLNNMAYTGVFDPEGLYEGVFEVLGCYQYSGSKYLKDTTNELTTADVVIDAGTGETKEVLSGACPAAYPWSGALLNFTAMRQIDIFKWVLMGGLCSDDKFDKATGGCDKQVNGQATFASTVGLDWVHLAKTADLVGRAPGSLWDDSCFSVPGMGGTPPGHGGTPPGQGVPPGQGTPPGQCSDSIYFYMAGSQDALKGKFCVDNDSEPPTGNTCADDDAGAAEDYAETEWTISLDLQAEDGHTTGIVQEIGDLARVGVMVFNADTTHGARMVKDWAKKGKDNAKEIQTFVPSGGRPLAESLYESTRFFAQMDPAYDANDYKNDKKNNDPYYFKAKQWARKSKYVSCCQTSVIILAAGDPSEDLNIPAGLKDYAQTDAYYLDDVARYVHITDLRSAGGGTLPILNEAAKALPGDTFKQTVTVYTVSAFGSSTALKDAAKYGGFTDTNGNNLPDLVAEWDQEINETGEIGTDGIPDNYREAIEAAEIKDKVVELVTALLERSGSGGSVSVLASSTTGEGAVFQAHFTPRLIVGDNAIKWAGFLNGMFLDAFGNLREDTDADGALVLKQDYIIKPRFDPSDGSVNVDRFKDDNGDGKGDSTTPFETIGIRDIKGIWEAGKRLALMDHANRNLLTWTDLDGDGFVDGGEQIAFTLANAETLAPFLDAKFDKKGKKKKKSAQGVIAYIRGEAVAKLRPREIDVGGSLKTWKLGDPIHSTPTLVGSPKERYDVIYGDASYATYFKKYRNRRQVVYMGANDGMLHAFNGGFFHVGDDPGTTTKAERVYFTRTATDNSSGALLGEELWGFIPQALLPQLKWLPDKKYVHTAYVDLKSKVTDARIFTPDTDHPEGWGTILIGGMRFGGSCGNCEKASGAPPKIVKKKKFDGSTKEERVFYSAYFALDITNPEVDPKLLWSFTDAELGLTTSYPAVVRVSPSADAKTDNTNAKWLMVVGSGPAGYDALVGLNQNGKVYVFDLKTGPKNSSGTSLVSTFATDLTSFMGDVIGLDADLDYRVDGVYGGNLIDNDLNATYDIDGELVAGSEPVWVGKMYRLNTNDGSPTLTTWGINDGLGNRVPTVLLSTYACSPKPCTGSTKVAGIIGAPTVTRDDADNKWVFFGTGRFFDIRDKTDPTPQAFFGVKDPVLSGGCTETSATSCEQNDIVSVSGSTICVVCDTGVNQVTNGPTGVTKFEGSGTDSLIGLVQSKDGWYTALSVAGERAITNPVILGGTVFFTSFTPNLDNVCGSITDQGEGRLYALFYRTGTAYQASVIGTETVGSNTNVLQSVSIGQGIGSQMSIHIGGQGSSAAGASSTSGCSSQVTGFVQSSTGALNTICGNPALTSWSHFLSWIHQPI